MPTVPPIDLAAVPDDVVECARLIAQGHDETLVGYRAITSSTPICTQGCLAPGSSPHSHSIIERWMVVTDRGVYEVDPDGICLRASTLHPFPKE